MITPQAIAEINAHMDTIRTPGLRIVCSYCRADLPGSDPLGRRISHGACSPLCAEARAMGWSDATPAAPPHPAGKEAA